jgi:creatinine amidohydrolase
MTGGDGRPTRWSLDRSPSIAQLAAAGAVAVQPIGAYEQHGPHLPLATDAILAEEFAAAAVTKLAGDLPVWVLPTIAYGASSEHVGFPGTISLSSSTLTAVCTDVASSVLASGIHRMIFVNAHGGNPELLQLLCRELRAATGMLAMTVHAPSLPGVEDGVGGIDVHGGRYETSVMLALMPEAVAQPLPGPDGLGIAASFDGFEHLAAGGVAAVPWLTSDVSAGGVIGDPSAADAEWGAAMFDAQATALAGIIGELSRFQYRPPTDPGTQQ